MGETTMQLFSVETLLSEPHNAVIFPLVALALLVFPLPEILSH